MRQNLELLAPSGLKLFIGIKAQIQHQIEGIKGAILFEKDYLFNCPNKEKKIKIKA